MDRLPKILWFALEVLILGLALLLGSINSAKAASYTWTGSSDNNWNTKQSWNPNTGNGGPTTSDSLTFGFISGNASGKTNLSNTAAVSGGSITFNADAQAYTIGGSSTLTLGSSTAHDIVNNSTNLQAFTVPITLNFAQTWNAANAGLSFSGTINGGTFLLTIDGANNTSISGVISGSGGLTKNGTGTLTLSGNNTMSGTVTLNAGTLKIGHASALGTGTFTVGGNGTFDNTTGSSISVANAFNLSGGSPTFTGTSDMTITGATTLSGANRTITVSANALTLGGVVGESGSRSLTKAGSGTLVMTNANTYSGGTTVSAGTLGVGNNFALGTGTLTFGGGTITAFGGARSITNSVTITTGNGTIGGTNSLTLSGSVTGSGGSRTLTVNNTGGTTLSGNVFLSDDNTTSGRTFTVNGTDNATISGVIANNNSGNTMAAGLTFSGSGTLTLSGANTYSGVTTVGSGKIKVQNNSALGTTANGTTVSSGAGLQIDGNGLSIAEALTLNGTGGGAGALENLANNNTVSGTVTFGSAARINSDSGTLTLSGGITGGNAVTFGGAGSITESGIIDSTITTLTYDGGGTLTLSGNNAYSGSTTVSSGTVKVGNDNALGSTAGGTTVSSGGVLDLNGRTIGNEAFTLNGSGISSAGALINSSGTGASHTGTVNLNTDTTIGGSGNTTLSGVISGSGRLTKTGSGTLTLNNANTYTGGTTLSQGTLKLGVNNALGTGGFNFNGGTLDANNTTDSTIGALTLSANSILQLHSDATHGTLTFDSASQTAGLLTIIGWTGTALTAGTDDRIFVTGTAGQSFLDNIFWQDQSITGAVRMGSGEIVPVPEPTEWALIIFAVLAAFYKFVLPRLRQMQLKPALVPAARKRSEAGPA